MYDTALIHFPASRVRAVQAFCVGLRPLGLPRPSLSQNSSFRTRHTLPAAQPMQVDASSRKLMQAHASIHIWPYLLNQHQSCVLLSCSGTIYISSTPSPPSLSLLLLLRLVPPKTSQLKHFASKISSAPSNSTPPKSAVRLTVITTAVATSLLFCGLKPRPTTAAWHHTCRQDELCVLSSLSFISCRASGSSGRRQRCGGTPCSHHYVSRWSRGAGGWCGEEGRLRMVWVM